MSPRSLPQGLAPPTLEQERGLLARIQTGDADAEAELVARNLRLVLDVSRRYQSHGADKEDLVQEGMLGLLKAVRKFDPSRGTRFSTFAVWWIRQAISRFVKGPTRAIRIPEYIHDRIARVLKVRDELSDHGEAPDEGHLAARVGEAPRDVKKLLEYSRETLSLEAPVSGSVGLRVGDALVSEGREPGEELGYRSVRRALVQSLGELPGRQTWILAHRYGLADGRKRSRPWIGERLGISAERVRQLEQQALDSLRKRMPEESPAA